MGNGLRKPKLTAAGIDFAGHVEAVGRSVTQFVPGDEVFGGRTGAYAEYVCVREDRVVLKPANLTFEQAAAVPVAALTALQGLRDKGRIQPGHRVLVNGAGGGVGTFAVQIAKSFGAHVTGVCSSRGVERVRSIGADQVIDYTQHDFTRNGQRYNLILDNVGTRSLADRRRALAPDGILVLVSDPRPTAGWAPDVYRQSGLGFPVRERQDGADIVADGQGGSGDFERTSFGWQDSAGHRPALSVGQGAGGSRVPGRRTRPREVVITVSADD
jgi:NADPH:quinone reductase-like Zn-dependent oxidoreductase